MESNRMALVMLLSVVIYLVGAGFAGAWIRHSEESCSSGVAGVDCKKELTRTNYKNDGSGEYLHSADRYLYQSKMGKPCQSSVDSGRTTLRNARIEYSGGFIPTDNWGGQVIIEQFKEGEWSYQLHVDVVCN